MFRWGYKIKFRREQNAGRKSPDNEMDVQMELDRTGRIYSESILTANTSPELLQGQRTRENSPTGSVRAESPVDDNPNPPLRRYFRPNFLNEIMENSNEGKNLKRRNSI